MGFVFGGSAFDGYASAIYGSTAASGTLLLSSTSHATKGKVFLGASSAYDEAQGFLGIGLTSPTYLVHLRANVTGSPAGAKLVVQNQHTGGSASFELLAGGDLLASSYGPTQTGSILGNTVAGNNALVTFGGSLLIGPTGASPIVFGTTNLERAQIDAAGNFVVGTAAIATTATDGFIYIATCAGTPTGTPSAKTGRAAMVYDTTANKWWIYNGAWRGVVLT